MNNISNFLAPSPWMGRTKRKRKNKTRLYRESPNSSEEDNVVEFKNLFSDKHRGYKAFSKISKEQLEDYLGLPTSKWTKWLSIKEELTTECPISTDELSERVNEVLKTSPKDFFAHNHGTRCRIFNVFLQAVLKHTNHLIVQPEGYQGRSEYGLSREDVFLTPLAPIIEIKVDAGYGDIFQLLAMLKYARYINFTSNYHTISECYGVLTDCLSWIFVKVKFAANSLAAISVEYSKRYELNFENLDNAVIALFYQICKRMDDLIDFHKKNTVGYQLPPSHLDWTTDDVIIWVKSTFPNVSLETLSIFERENVTGRILHLFTNDQLIHNYGFYTAEALEFTLYFASKRGVEIENFNVTSWVVQAVGYGEGEDYVKDLACAFVNAGYDTKGVIVGLNSGLTDADLDNIEQKTGFSISLRSKKALQFASLQLIK